MTTFFSSNCNDFNYNYYVLRAKWVQHRFNNNPFLNPALIGSIGVIAILLILGMNYKSYMIGGQWINHLLNATVVCLAYPLYENRHKN